jgi:23S rRNA (guanosine2251-2'-O)-methyltransferase
MKSTLFLRNPHSVLEVLKNRPKDIIEVALSKDLGKLSDDWKNVHTLAQKKNVKITSALSKETQNRFEDGRQTLAEVKIQPKEEVSFESLFSGAKERKNGKGLWLALDCIQDTHNLGAIFRTAAFFGVEGILLTQERSAPLTGTVYDVACGGVEVVPFHNCVNLKRTLDEAKELGVWVLGTSEHAKVSIEKISVDRPRILVLGNEEKGMRRLTEDTCDEVVSIPCMGKVTSLNVSVANGILVSKLSGL